MNGRNKKRRPAEAGRRWPSVTRAGVVAIIIYVENYKKSRNITEILKSIGKGPKNSDTQGV